MAMINGWTVFNVIPDLATIAGTYRAFSNKSFYALEERIKEVVYNSDGEGGFRGSIISHAAAHCVLSPYNQRPPPFQP